tara:strand:+ start:270 stop:518 length:249 start_codon:yes stop_codon:yes gene_type:complete
MIINILIVFFGYLIGLYLLKSLNPIIEPVDTKKDTDNKYLSEKIKELEESQNNNLVTIQGLTEDIEDIKIELTADNFIENKE